MHFVKLKVFHQKELSIVSIVPIDTPGGKNVPTMIQLIVFRAGSGPCCEELSRFAETSLKGQ